MTPFLDQLESELDRAAGRIVSGRRRTRGAAAALMLAGVAVVAVVAWPRHTAPEREARPAGPPKPYVLPGPPPALADVPITVASSPATTQFEVFGDLRRAGWRTEPPGGPSPEVHTDVDDLEVVYGTAPREQAELAARTLGIAAVGSAERPGYDELRDAPLSLVVGRHPRFGGAVAAYRARFSVLGADGTGRVDTERGPVKVLVFGAGICVFNRMGGTCADYDGAVSGRSILTTETEGADVLAITALVPDGISYVMLGDERVPVTGNVWVHGRTDARAVEIPGIGRIRIGAG